MGLHDLQYTGVLLVITLVLVALGAAELAWHRRRLRRIKIRVHVNGSRGKSSVTRLIAAGLRQANVRTFAKTTGTLPTMILPDGRDLPIARLSQANIIEQIRTVSAAAAVNAEALVVECMALRPELQWLSEGKLLEATHGVITNVRPDHLEVMGPDEHGVALALAATVPRGGRLYTAETTHTAVFAAACRDRGAALVALTPDDIAAVAPSELAAFRYREHGDNVALALRVCAELGVEREVALRGMQRARPDPGALTEHRLRYFGREILFVNGFAANDPVSTEQVWRTALARHGSARRRIAVFNCRADRADRSLQLGRAFAAWDPAQVVVLMGTGTHLWMREANSGGLCGAEIVVAEGKCAYQLFELILSQAGRAALVVGMGNIGGEGLELVQYFCNRAEPDTQETEVPC